MPETDRRFKRAKGEILREIDAALPVLPREQQNMVAAFAKGLHTGWCLRETIEPASEAKQAETTITLESLPHRE